MDELEIRVVKLTDTIYMLEQAPEVRAFLILGEKSAILLDTGMIPMDLPKMINELTDLPVTLVLTHGDGDHTGNAHYFNQAWLHPAEFTNLVADHMKDIELLAMEDGHIFDLGGRRIRVVHIPGHTPGSVGLLDEASGEFFSGDTVSHAPVFMFGPTRQPEQFLSSLKKLKDMADNGEISVIYPCHAECPVPVSAIDELIACTEGMLNHTMEGEKAQLPVPNGPIVKLYKCGNSGIFTMD